jgi:hypothetical protein
LLLFEPEPSWVGASGGARLVPCDGWRSKDGVVVVVVVVVVELSNSTTFPSFRKSFCSCWTWTTKHSVVAFIYFTCPSFVVSFLLYMEGGACSVSSDFERRTFLDVIHQNRARSVGHYHFFHLALVTNGLVDKYSRTLLLILNV